MASPTQEVIDSVFDSAPVVLISANLPGCGSSTLAEGLAKTLSDRGGEVYTCYVGKKLREMLGVNGDEELHAKLAEINDPHAFDPAIYGDLPQDRTCIIEGKLATTAGPKFIDAEKRPIVSIDLTARPLFSAKRILHREGKSLAVLFGESPDSLIIEQLARIGIRSAHDHSLRGKIDEIEEDAYKTAQIVMYRYDTSKLSPEEIINDILGIDDHEDRAPDWELDALKETLKTLTLVGLDLREVMNPQDKVHYDHQIESITYNMDRLRINLNPHGLEQIRSDLKKAIIDCWYGLMLKRTPRFFIDRQTNDRVYDTESHSWSPEYYKIAEGWPTLSTLLKDKTVLDPFAGAGTLMNLLVARGIPKSAVYADISYPGGKTVNSGDYWYDPVLNTQASQLLFDDLPSWYKPDFSASIGYITADAHHIPLQDDSVDYVFADPPYGKNLDGPGLGVLFGCLSEFKRVAKEGSIFMVPVQWLEDIKSSGTDFKQLTGDVSGGKSGFPVCYILVS